ncbi:MAG TPA: ABC transporter substrate-binding protein [Stellaceae bacterium]|nr:ABC transporter substrate-binding protein [Stellaceae bacterium]
MPATTRRILASLGILASLACLSALIGAPAARAAEPFDIDVVLPLTGGGSFLGHSEQTSLQLAEPVLNKDGGIGGRPVHFVYHDDQSSPQVAVQLATQVVARKPPVVLGSALVAMCNAMTPLMARGPVMYCFSPGTSPKPGGFAYGSSSSTYDLAGATLRYLELTGRTKVAIIASTDATGQEGSKMFTTHLAMPAYKNIQLVGQASFNPTDVSAAAQIHHLKASNPQVLIAWSTGSAIGTVFKAIKDAGLNVPVVTTDGNMTFAQMHQFASILPKPLYIPTAQWPKSDIKLSPAVEEAKKVFYDTFDKAGIKPDFGSTLSWSAAMLTVSALKKLGPDATAAQLNHYLSTLKGFAGINGIYDFTKTPQRGLDETSVVLTRWDADKDNWILVSKPQGFPVEK